MPDRFAFLPHTQSSLASLAEAPAPGSARLRLPYEVEIARDGVATGSRVSVASDLIGPGDVQTIDQAVIARVEPKPSLRAFEPNYFPHIEFRDADFPWRYSLDRRSGAQKTPWIALIALEASEFSFIDTARSPLKRIRVADQASSLPDPGGLALTAHVQANASEDMGDTAKDRAEAALSGDAEAASRILCMRRLKPTKTYYGFLVPVYEAGRLTGLGESDQTASFDQFAWGASTGPIDLPVYFDWRFVTDEAEDIELLLRRLTALNANALAQKIGDTSVTAKTPGYFDRAYPGEGFQRQSAMQIPSNDPPKLTTSDALVSDMIPVLDEVIQSADPEGKDDEDPLVAFPAYGAKYKPEVKVDKGLAEERRWFDMINLDLKFRHAAGLGADIVRKNQEVFSHLAWRQYEDIAAANERLARLQAAQAMAERLVNRHFDNLPSDVALALAQPLLGVVEVTKGKTVAAALADNGAPLSTAARSLRRQSAKRTRPVSRVSGKEDAVPMPGVPGDASPSATARLGRADADPKDLTVGIAPVRDAAGLIEGAGAVLRPLFADDAFEGVQHSKTPVASVARFSSEVMAGAVSATLARLPVYKSATSVQGLTVAERKAPAPVWRSPSIAQPMGAYLSRVSTKALFAGADELPDNTVAIVEENRPFIEAFLVGMNHEMNRELRWREFPTDMRGTVFRRFWNRGRAADDQAGDDIGPIHDWEKPLGRNAPQSAANADENLIVIIRGDIVRKLDDPVLAINIADDRNGFEAGKGRNLSPSFVGRISRDLSYFGFEIAREDVTAPAMRDRVFFVIYEPAGRLRFGLDIGTAAVRHARRDERAIAHGFSIAALKDRPYRATRRYEGRTAPAANAGGEAGTPPLAAISDWDELSWTHAPLQPSGYIDLSSAIPAPISPNHLGPNRTSASVARAFWQKPIAGVLPVRRVV